jgi:hypothetical protein
VTSRNEFIRGLIADARIPSVLATEQGATAVGIGTFYGIFLRADELQPSPLHVRVGIIAHELVHAGLGRLVDLDMASRFSRWIGCCSGRAPARPGSTSSNPHARRIARGNFLQAFGVSCSEFHVDVRRALWTP